MKPRNAVYIGGPPLDEPDQCVMINCTYCRKFSYSADWIKNRGHCPLCQKAFAGKLSED